MKTVGIIGGLGPETTSVFYLKLISLLRERDKIRRPSILIFSIPIPLVAEKLFITRGKSRKVYLSLLIDAARRLEKAGACFLVIPYNSVHIFIKEIRDSVKIPVLSIVEETAKVLEKKRVKKAGIIATPVTLDNRLYEVALSSRGIAQYLPSKYSQDKIGVIIHNLVSGYIGEEEREGLMRVILDFKADKVKDIILACTDLQLVMPQNAGVKIHDTLEILALASAKIMSE